MGGVAAILSLPDTARLPTYDSALLPPAPPPSPAEDAGVQVLNGGNEVDAAATAVLTPTTSAATVAGTVKPVASLYDRFRDTATAITPLPATVRRLTYDDAPPASATAVSPDQNSGDPLLGGGGVGVAVTTNMPAPGRPTGFGTSGCRGS